MKIDWNRIELILENFWNSIDPLEQRIIRICTGGVSEGVLRNKIRPKNPDESLRFKRKMAGLIYFGDLIVVEKKHGRRKSNVKYYECAFHANRQKQFRKIMDLMAIPVGARIEFDVSRRCDDLIMDIQEATRNIEWHMPGKELAASLSQDKKTLFVERIK